MVETAQIKPIQNRSYNTTGHNYELTLNHSTKIQEVGETLSRDVPSTLYHFVSISDLSDKPEKEKVDVIGVILEVRDVQDLTTRAGRQTKKRGFQITDSSNCKINATIWGDKAENFPADAINKIIAIKGAEVSEWQGKSLNMGFTSTFEIEPPLCQEAEVLRDWFDREGNCASTQSLTNTSFSVPSGSNKDLVSLAEVKQNVYSNTVADSVKYFNVEASVIIIKTDNIMYRACPNESCRRKVNEDPANSGEFKCQKCDKQYPNFNWRYSLQAAIADFTDFHWVTIFEESGMNILGISAEELARKKDQNRIEYEKILENCKYLSFQFAMKSKVESWNDEKRLRLSIVKAEKVSRDSMDRINRLTSDIDRLKILLNL
jgi:replication factor A1